MSYFNLDKKAFGKQLKQLRNRAKEKQEDLANILGIARSSISAYESGKNVPDAEILFRIAKHYSISTDKLLGLIEETTHEKKFIVEQIGLPENIVDILIDYKSSPKYTDDLLGLNYLIQFNKTERPLKGLGKCIRYPILSTEDFEDLKYAAIYSSDSSQVVIESTYEYDKDIDGFEGNQAISRAEIYNYQFRQALDATLHRIFNDKNIKKDAVEKLQDKYKDKK